MVGVREPQERDARPPIMEDLRPTPLSHGPVAGAIAAAIQRVSTADGLATGPKGTGRMIKKTKTVRIKKVGPSRRHVREGDEADPIGDALGEPRHAQRGAGGGAHMRAEIRLTDVADNDFAVHD